jgi:hypothetical protein
MRYNVTLKYRPTGNGKGSFKLTSTVNTQSLSETLQLLGQFGLTGNGTKRNFTTCRAKGEAPLMPIIP